jgi:hypothetical protein
MVLGAEGRHLADSGIQPEDLAPSDRVSLSVQQAQDPFHCNGA